MKTMETMGEECGGLDGGKCDCVWIVQRMAEDCEMSRRSVIAVCLEMDKQKKEEDRMRGEHNYEKEGY